MNGSLSIQAANPDFEWRATHKVVLKGHVVANWTPRQSDEDFEEIPSRTERIPLYDFASRHSLQELVVLCSGTAQTDITASLQRAGVDERPQFITANFTDESDFLNKVESLHGTFGVSALAVARGGGGGIDKIGNSRKIARALVESRMPFYVAIGHATDVVLLDKVADQAFHSPSELGASWARALNDRARQADQQKRIADIERRLADEQSAASEIAAQLSSWQDRLKRLACLHRYGISISWWGLFLALAGLGLWGWFRYFD